MGGKERWEGRGKERWEAERYVKEGKGEGVREGWRNRGREKDRADKDIGVEGGEK